MAMLQISPAAIAVLLSAAVCLMPALVCGSRHIPDAFVVQGRVFCDTCRAGFETPATTYIAGAKVRVECRTKTTGAKTCNFEGVTDSTGTYKIAVADEHEHEICESVLVSSPQSGCTTMVEGRERARVFLTRNNGIASDVRFANSMGFQQDIPLAGCARLMKQYEEYEV